MEISAVQSTDTTSSPSTGQISSDFETFLRMLTTQIENQDPLNPIESSDFAVQLATFSSVEQQVLTNDLLRELSGQFGDPSIAGLADWVGQDVRTTTATRFEGTPITLYPSVDPEADQATIIVRDANNAEIAQFAVSTDAAPITWAGVTADGAPYPNGNYTFSVESYRDGTLLGTARAETYQSVSEVRRTGTGDALLVLNSGAEIDPADVTALRAAGR